MGSWGYMKWRIWIGAGVADMDTCNRYGWRQGNIFLKKGIGLEIGGTIPFTNYVSAFQVSHFTVVSLFFSIKKNNFSQEFPFLFRVQRLLVTKHFFVSDLFFLLRSFYGNEKMQTENVSSFFKSSNLRVITILLHKNNIEKIW